MKYIYAAVVALLTTTGYGYDTLVPQYNPQVLVVNPVPVPMVTQTMVYHAPYFTVSIPVQVTAPVAVAQPVQHTVYYWYPYQPAAVNHYWHHRCRLLNY